MAGENDEIKRKLAKNNSWYKLMQKSIKLDGKEYPHGYHWFIAFHQLPIATTLTKTIENLPEKHPLKSQLLPPENIIIKLKPITSELKSLLGSVKKDMRIDFSGLHFEKSIDFSNFIFPIYVSFEQSKFSGNVSFENAVFNDYSNFKETKFKRRIVFQQTVFESHAPRFYGATFSNELILNRVDLPESKKFKKFKKFKDAAEYNMYQKTIEENKSAYETLIYHMEEQNKHHDKHRFFREEMRWRQLGSKLTQQRIINDFRKAIDAKYPRWGRIRNFLISILCCFYNTLTCCFSRMKPYIDYIWKRIENRLTITLFGLYDHLSDYGYGIGRALFWWFSHILIGAVIIFGLRYFNCFKDFTDDFGCSLGISLSNSHAFFFNGERLEKCYKAFENLPWFNFIWGVQTITGTLLIFLVLLTLRIRFRLK